MGFHSAHTPHESQINIPRLAAQRADDTAVPDPAFLTVGGEEPLDPLEAPASVSLVPVAAAASDIPAIVPAPATQVADARPL